jgi:hypothetical protein
LPGINISPICFTDRFRNVSIRDQGQRHGLPSKEDIAKAKKDYMQNSKLFLLKLHGSCNWTSTVKERQMVIGRAKAKQIEEEPLLSWYFDMFKTVVCKPDRKLLSIGYGFRDEHINEFLAEGVSSHGLRIFIISPSDPSETKEGLSYQKNGKIIWDGLGGYFQYSFSQMFPTGESSDSIGWVKVQEQFFDGLIP